MLRGRTAVCSVAAAETRTEIRDCPHIRLIAQTQIKATTHVALRRGVAVGRTSECPLRECGATDEVTYADSNMVRGRGAHPESGRDEMGTTPRALSIRLAPRRGRR